MIFHSVDLDGAYVIDLEKHGDERGFFARVFCKDEFAEHGLETRYVQCNTSFSTSRHTLRGLHYQVNGAEEVKVVRCTKGALLDVIIDLRPESPTFARHVGVELTEANYRMLYVPRGFAHGFVTLVDEVEVFYMVSEFYAPGKERGIRWDDPYFAVEWPTRSPIVSAKDAAWPDFTPPEAVTST